MSDSSEDEDLSRFREVVDVSIVDKLLEQNCVQNGNTKAVKKQKSERYLETSTHYNDVKVSDELQNRIGQKLSAVIKRNIEFVDVDSQKIKKNKIKGGVKLFKDSADYLTCEEITDTYTSHHNSESKKICKRRRHIDEVNELKEIDKLNAVVVTGDYILSKKEIRLWKSRRKEKIFRYKSSSNNVLTAIAV